MGRVGVRDAMDRGGVLSLASTLPTVIITIIVYVYEENRAKKYSHSRPERGHVALVCGLVQRRDVGRGERRAHEPGPWGFKDTEGRKVLGLSRLAVRPARL